MREVDSTKMKKTPREEKREREREQERERRRERESGRRYPLKRMIEVILNDRLGKKIRVKCK